MRIRAVFFDIDGTLVDVAAATARCVAEIAVSAGARPVAAQAIVAASRSTRDRRDRFARWVSTIVEEHGGRVRSELEVRRALDGVARHVVPDPRTTAAVARIRRDFRVGVISNGRQRVQRTKLRAAGLMPLFDPRVIYISGELGLRKPTAAIFERAMRETGVEPDATLFVGDDEADDIVGARAAGMATCRIAPPGTATAAEHRVEHVAELVQVLSCGT